MPLVTMPALSPPDNSDSRPGLDQALLVCATPISYATAPNAKRYAAIMRALYENRNEYGPHLTPAQISGRVRSNFGIAMDSDQIAVDLEQLKTWGDVSPRQETARVRSASDLILKQYAWDITPAGEACERFLIGLGELHDVGGSLQSQRLTTIHAQLLRIARELASDDPSSAELQENLTNLVAALDALRDGAQKFMRDLSDIMHSTDALDVGSFLTYKTQVTDYLTGFSAELERTGRRIRDAITDVERLGLDRLFDLVASQQEAPSLDLTAEEVRARARRQPEHAWTGVRSWFVAGLDDRPHFQILEDKIVSAIGWIVRSAQRLRERTSQRVDRSTEYRHLAGLFHNSATDDDAHALFAATFGLYSSRHFGCAPEEPDDTPARRSFWDAAPAQIEGSLRNPNRRAANTGRGSRVIDNTEAKVQARAKREREREQVDGACAIFAHQGPTRLSSLPALDEIELEYLLTWLGFGLSSSVDEDGLRRAVSDDGLVNIVLHDPESHGSDAVIRATSGTLHAPDYAIEVSRV